jgi:hypothetical protein
MGLNWWSWELSYFLVLSFKAIDDTDDEKGFKIPSKDIKVHRRILNPINLIKQWITSELFWY